MLTKLADVIKEALQAFGSIWISPGLPHGCIMVTIAACLIDFNRGP